MLGQLGNIEGFNVSEWITLPQPWNIRDICLSAGCDKDALALEDARAASFETDLDRHRANECSLAIGDLGPTVFKDFDEILADVFDHVGLAFNDLRDVNGDLSYRDTEIRGFPDEGRCLGAADDVFGGQAGDIGAGSSELTALDANSRIALLGKVPSHCFASVTRPYNDVAIRFHDTKILFC